MTMTLAKRQSENSSNHVLIYFTIDLNDIQNAAGHVSALKLIPISVSMVIFKGRNLSDPIKNPFTLDV